MSVLFLADERFLEHNPGSFHPEVPRRLSAVVNGLRMNGLTDALILHAPTPAEDEALFAVHDEEMLAALEGLRLSSGNSFALDADTYVSPGSLGAARLAAGAGLVAVDVLSSGSTQGATTAFCAVRPPGHHATAVRSMGFCLFNNVAVAAARLRSMGEKVLIVDYDAHHGNGTQDIFYSCSEVFYVSMHQYPAYPGTGALEEVGVEAGRGTTLNLPFPPGTTGDVYLQAWEEVVLPAVERFSPDWLLLSAGFDAHRADPLTSLGLSCGDFADLTAAAAAVVGPSRVIAFLEGGYNLEALANSAAACVAALAGEVCHLESPTSGGPGKDVLSAAAAIHTEI